MLQEASCGETWKAWAIHVMSVQDGIRHTALYGEDSGLTLCQHKHQLKETASLCQ